MNEARLGFNDLGVVVPVLNEVGEIVHWIRHIARELPGSGVVVADGGSRDGTLEAIQTMQIRRLTRRPDAGVSDLRVRVIHSETGRGAQLANGAHEALRAFDVAGLLFLHVDTALTPGAGSAIRAALDDTGFAWGWFGVSLDGPALGERLIERGLSLRAGLTRVPLGQQGLLVTTERYLRSGGFKPLVGQEDSEFGIRLRRQGAGRRLPAHVITSGRGYRQGKIDSLWPLHRRGMERLRW